MSFKVIRYSAFRSITYSFPLVCRCNHVSIFTVSEVLPLVSEVPAYVTILEKYLRSNAAVEVVVQTIVVISFVGDIRSINQ